MASKKQIYATLVMNTTKFQKGITTATSKLKGLKGGSNTAEKGIKSLHNASKSCGSGLGSMVKGLAGLAIGAVSVGAVVSVMKDCVEAANVQATAEKRLETTMMNVKGTTIQQVDAMKQYTAELQKNTTIGDEVTMQGASQLATFGLQSDSIKSLLPQLQNMAVAQYGVSVSGDQMQSVANTIGKAMGGNATALKKLIPSMTKEQELLIKNGTEAQKTATITELLQNKYGDLAKEMANTPEGRIQQLKNAWGDMQEVIGAKLYPVITKVLTWVMDKIPAIQSYLEPIVETIGNNIAQAMEIIMPIADKIFNAVKNILSASSPMAGVFDTIRTVVGQLWTVIKDLWSTITSAFQDAFAKNDRMKTIITNVKTIISAVGTVVSGLWNIIKPAIPYVIDFLAGVITFGSNIVATVATVISAIVTGISNAVTWTQNAINTISQFFTNIKNGIVNLFNGVVSSVKTVINGVITILNGAISKIFSGINSILSSVGSVASALGLSDGNWSITTPQIPMLANGGNVVGSGSAIVGERGPELLTLPKGASVTPLSKSSNNNFTITINAQDRSCADIINELVPQLKLALANI